MKEGSITQAIIIAGGFGTRLRPHTSTVPKPMIPLAGKPMLQWRLEQFKKYGVTEFFFTLNYLPEVVMDHFGDGSRFGVRVHYLIESKPLDTFGGVKLIEDQLHKAFFFGYGDVLAFLDYSDMAAEYFKKEDAIGIQHVTKSDAYEDADVAELDAEGKLTKIYTKPHKEKYAHPVYRMQGTGILNKRILSYVPVDTPCNLGNQLTPTVVAAGEKFYGYESDGYITWIDTPEKWKAVDQHLRTWKNQP